MDNEHFLKIDDEMLDFLEKQAEVLINDLNESRKRNKDKAIVLFNLLLSGSGGAFLLWSTNELPHYLGLAVLLISVLWGITAIYLLINSISLKMRPALGNSPGNLYLPLYQNFDEYQDWLKAKNIAHLTPTGIMRRFELCNLNQTINDLAQDNKEQVQHMNRAMYIAAMIPLLGLLIA